MATYKKWTSTVLVNGQPEPNVKVYVYEPGTTNEIPIYEDEGVTPITQPILTDSQGRYAFFVDVDTYPEIRLYLEKDGVDFSEVNEDLDGVPVPGSGAGGTGGASTFLELNDTPSDYTGNAGKVVRVNASEDGLEFGTVSGGAGTFTELTDTPSSYVGRGGDVVVVKTTEDGIETQPWPVTGTVLNVFLSDDAADVGSYYYMYPDETGDGSTELTSPSLSTGDDQLLWSFVTEAEEPGIDQLALGAYTATLFLKKSGNKDVRVYWKLFKRDTGGTETEILQSAVSDYLTADNSQYLISGYLNEDQALDPTDRLVLKLYANVSGTGTDVTVTLTMEGDYDSRLTINVLSSAFNLDRLSDVTITSPADNELLAYDSGSGKWINQTASEAGILAADGSVPLSADWDIGDTRKILADQIRARDAAGLKLTDDAGNGVFVEDGGNVGIGTTGPTEKLHVEGSIYCGNNFTYAGERVMIKGWDAYDHNWWRNYYGDEPYNVFLGFVRDSSTNEAKFFKIRPSTRVGSGDDPAYTLDVVGDIHCTGKLTSDGGNDPPYVLYNYETRASIIDRVKKEVLPDKLDGAVLFFNGDQGQLELFLPSKGEFRTLDGKVLETVEPITETFETENRYYFDENTGEIKSYKARKSVRKYRLKPDHELDPLTGKVKRKIKEKKKDPKTGEEIEEIVGEEEVSLEKAIELVEAEKENGR